MKTAPIDKHDDINEKLTVVIRCGGERTEALCKALILAQGVLPENIAAIREVPFSAALRKGYEIGIAREKPWTLHLDADVLLRPGAISQMLFFAEQQEKNVCQIQGKVIDKFFGGPRDGGIHLYRTSLLSEALSCIPEEGVDIRPETYTLEAIGQAGYPRVKVPYIIGIHDFEQFYKDIFRKCFVQGHKHTHFAVLFLAIWRESAAEDKDFHVALKGFAAGIIHFGQVLIDLNQNEYENSYCRYRIEEKPDLPEGSYSLDDIERIITTWVDHEAYRKIFPTRCGLDPGGLLAFFSRKRLHKLYRTLGPFRVMPYLMGAVLFETGKKIKTWAERKLK